MPVELHGIYYTVSEIATMLGLSVPTTSQYLSRNGYKKVNFNGKKKDCPFSMSLKLKE